MAMSGLWHIVPHDSFYSNTIVSACAIAPTNTILQDNAIRYSHWLATQLHQSPSITGVFLVELLSLSLSSVCEAVLRIQSIIENQNGELLVDSSIAWRTTASVEQDSLERRLTRRTCHWYYTFSIHWVLFRCAEKEKVVNNGGLEPCGQWRTSTTATVLTLIKNPQQWLVSEVIRRSRH